MGRHSDDRAKAPVHGKGEYVGKHRKPEVKTEVDTKASFHVESPERVDRGVGDNQTGGRD
jgi:hypothetical protein